MHGNGLFVLAAEDLLALRDYTIVEVDPFIEGRTVVLRLQAPELPDIELHVEGGYWKVLFDGG